MRFFIVIGLFLGVTPFLFSQKTQITGRIQDRNSGEVIVGVSVSIPTLKIGTTSAADGSFTLAVESADSVQLRFVYVGYDPVSLKVLPATVRLPLDIRLQPAAELEEVTISTTRTHSRIEDLPVKVEVLGREELEEEVSLVPGGMGSLLGDLSVITIQRTGAVSGNDAVRMQGLASGYTQLLQDGLPLYGGFSGSLGVLNIPPLDLRQVEIIKGSSSTLYGGGAIGGLINFLSKTPTATPKRTALLNQTTLGETNANAYISQKTNETQGFTLLAAGTSKPARDLNADGFAEIAHSRQILLHPRFFWGMGQRTSGDVGVTVSENQLRGGDYAAIQQGEATLLHPFFQKETARRLTANGQIATHLSEKWMWTLRGAGSMFKRGGEYAGLQFAGQQTNAYLETNAVCKQSTDDWVIGANVTSERFHLIEANPTLAFGSTAMATAGFFVQNDHRFSEKWALQIGFRIDRNTRYGTFALPRASLLYKPSPVLSARLGYGRGYKTPDLFLSVEPTDFKHLQPLSTTVRPDLAHSLNADLNYQKLLFDALSLQVNQAFYAVQLARPFELTTDAQGNLSVLNSAGKGRVLGTDTYVQLHYAAWELYVGYNHTRSIRHFEDGRLVNEPFNPQDKVAATLAWSMEDTWRFGVETAYLANQYVNDNRRVPAYWFWAAMVARSFRWGTLVLNCENVGDARQARQEALVTGGFQHPVFAPIWGAVEGRVLNLSVKVDW